MELMNGDNTLFIEISSLIEQSRRAIYAQASSATVLLFWEIGRRINADVLENKRAGYGKQIVSKLSTQLTEKYGRSFAVRNLRRMMQFVEQFPDFEIVSSVTTQLTWTHIVELLPLKSHEAKLFYMSEVSRELITVKQLRGMISRKVFERKEIADTKISPASPIPRGTFRDPYLFDVLGIKDEYLEEDLEEAILRELEKFILEFGKGFSFVERQKRMIIDGEDFKLDLLMYNRRLKRLVAIELKKGKFEYAYSAQMKLYLKWLSRYEREESENEPIGLILCTSGNHREQIELLEMDRDGIMVAEYWTALPPKVEFEQKIQAILTETRERMTRRNLLLPVEEKKKST
jgi:predicted nuclease of restriction endonuclease-like (RecB) superfamily